MLRDAALRDRLAAARSRARQAGQAAVAASAAHCVVVRRECLARAGVATPFGPLPIGPMGRLAYLASPPQYAMQTRSLMEPMVAVVWDLLPLEVAPTGANLASHLTNICHGLGAQVTDAYPGKSTVHDRRRERAREVAAAAPLAGAFCLTAPSSWHADSFSRVISHVPWWDLCIIVYVNADEDTTLDAEREMTKALFASRHVRVRSRVPWHPGKRTGSFTTFPRTQASRTFLSQAPDEYELLLPNVLLCFPMEVMFQRDQTTVGFPIQDPSLLSNAFPRSLAAERVPGVNWEGLDVRQPGVSKGF